jgi:hypothetical protein
MSVLLTHSLLPYGTPYLLLLIFLKKNDNKGLLPNKIVKLMTFDLGLCCKLI